MIHADVHNTEWMQQDSSITDDIHVLHVYQDEFNSKLR